jgi:NurA domain
MSVDFQQVRQQVIELGEAALGSVEQNRRLLEEAQQLLHEHALDHDALRRKVERVVQAYDSNLRCALPLREALDQSYPLPPVPEQATVLAADGSQIAPSRHEAFEYAMINVGAIQMNLGTPQAPLLKVESRLLYDKQIEDLTDATLALLRDLSERRLLAELAEELPPGAITFTDGQMELWLGEAGGRDERSLFQQSLLEYKQVLQQLCACQVSAAGYVDRPAGRSVIRLLEVAQMPEVELPEIRRHKPFRGLRDLHLFRGLLRPGERSAVFEIQSPSSSFYAGELGLHFFYLNVGREGRDSLARVEVPRWVVDQPAMLNDLHAVLVQQCRVMGARPYPYLLHRAHETALVTLQEKEQVTQMVLRELRTRGIEVDEKSNKQLAKDL